MVDHVHLMISISPKYAVAQVIGFIKGKSVTQIAHRFSGKRRNYTGKHFWARGYFALTVGRYEQIIRAYIKHQVAEGRRLDQLRLM